MGKRGGRAARRGPPGGRVAAPIEKELAECRRLVAELRVSEERYRAVVQDQADAISRFGPDFVVTFTNEAFCRALRTSGGEPSGKSFLEFLPEADRERVVQAIRGITRAQPLCTIEHPARGGGEPRWYQWTIRGIFDAEGRLVEHLGVGRDITERRRAEQALAQRNQELDRVNRELERLHREKDVLIAMVSHELRTPLVTGLGYLDMLLSGAFGRISTMAAEKMGVARKNLERLAELIDDLLDYQRLLLSSPCGLALGPVDLRELLEEARDELLERFGLAPACVTLAVAPSLPAAWGHREMLKRVLANLLDNTQRHGGVGCRVRLEAKVEEDGSLCVSVSDEGPGMRPELAVRAFDLFVKGDESTGGRGVGLAIVRAILNAHRARLELHSLPGRGTCLRFWLRVAPVKRPIPLVTENA